MFENGTVLLKYKYAKYKMFIWYLKTNRKNKERAETYGDQCSKTFTETYKTKPDCNSLLSLSLLLISM